MATRDDKKSEVWKKVLEKRVSSDKLLNAKSVKQKEKPYEVQIFEVLSAETLNLHDPLVEWEVTKAGGDGGIDLIGYEKRNTITPFVAPFQLVSLGQVKRRGSSYRYDTFKSDVGKISEYCLNTNFFNEKSLKQVVFVVSTSSPKRVETLKKRMETENNPWLANQKPSYIGFIDANDLVKSWKLNYHHFEMILQDALTSEEMDLFKAFIDQYDYSWLSVSVTAPSISSIGEPVLQALNFNIETNDMDVDVIVRWIPPEDSNVQLLHPLRLCDPRQQGLPIHIHKKSQMILAFRGLASGNLDFGFIELRSQNAEQLIHLKLGNVEITKGFFPYFFDKPNKKVMQDLERLCIDSSREFMPVLVHGCGGIGKSALISEVLIHAAERGFLCVDVAQPKDRHHSRYLLKELLKNIVFPNQLDICFDSSLLNHIRNIMGQNYNPLWEEDLFVYLTDDEKECSIRTIAECLTTAVLIAAEEKPIFLWLSDLHWISEETVNILKIVIDELHSNQIILNHRVVWLFEGRDDESIIINHHPFFPAQWHAFMENNLLHKFQLQVWNPEDSKEFLKEQFLVPESENILYETLIEQILQKANGVPMHMLELVKMLLEKGNAVLAEGQRLLIVNHNYTECMSEDIINAIKNRIDYYRTVANDFVDILIVFSYLGCEIPGHLVSMIMKGLNSSYINFDLLKKQSAFIQEQNNSVTFAHEHYATAFQTLSIKNEDILNRFISYYEKLHSPNDNEKFALLTLKKYSSQTNWQELRKSIITFIKEEPSLTLTLSLYGYLLELPPLIHAEEDLPTYYILFQLCELNIRSGSWKTAQYYLQKQLDLPYEEDINAVIYRIKAAQEMSNILADRLYFEKAAREAENGLELAELWLDKGVLTEKQSHSICREQTKLLARLAVCYWFAGNLKKAAGYQKESYRLASRQKDRYAAAHVLYEIGTLEFHKRYPIGLKIMSIVRDSIDTIPNLKKYEGALIEIQTLIGLLMKAAAEEDTALLRKVKLRTREYKEYHKKQPNSYEEFLNDTIRGICFVLEENWQEALLCFFDSLKKATESDMPNLEWKAVFNIAQLYMQLSPPAACSYAQRTRVFLDKAKKDNPRFADCLEIMLKPVYDRLDSIDNGRKLIDFVSEEELTMLAVKANGMLFVVMN